MSDRIHISDTCYSTAAFPTIMLAVLGISLTDYVSKSQYYFLWVIEFLEQAFRFFLVAVCTCDVHHV